MALSRCAWAILCCSQPSCQPKSRRRALDFMPLQVEYKRNSHLPDVSPADSSSAKAAPAYEILTARLVDRVLRPLFPKITTLTHFVNIVMYSADGVDMPDTVAGLAASKPSPSATYPSTDLSQRYAWHASMVDLSSTQHTSTARARRHGTYGRRNLR